MPGILDDIYRQYGLSNPYEQTQQQALPAQPRPAPAIPPLSPQEEEGALSHLGSGALGGLAYLGSSLSKAFGGRAIRGLLGGRPEELASIIPFSDALGITNPENEVRGSDLLGGNKDTSFLSPEGVGGLGLEIALDPATYLSFGTLTGAGQAAQKAGTLTRGLLPSIKAGERSLVSAGLPFTSAASQAHLTGDAATNLLNTVGPAVRKVPVVGNPLANAAGKVYDNVLEPAGRNLSALFDKSVMGQTRAPLQEIARDVSAGREAATAGAMGKLTPLVEYAHANDLLTPDAGRMLRQQLEGTMPVSPLYEPLVSGQKGIQEDMLQRLQDVGLADKPLADTIGYAPRQATLQETQGAGLTRRGLAPAQQQTRKDMLRGLPTEGQSSINQLTQDAAVTGAGRPLTDLEAAHYIRTKYLGVNDQELADLRTLREAQPDLFKIGQGGPSKEYTRLAELEAKTVQAQHLQDWTKGLDPEAMKQVGGFFSNHPLQDLQGKLIKDTTRELSGQAIHRGIAQTAVPLAQGGADLVPLDKVLQDAGLTLQVGDHSGAMSATLKAMQDAGHQVGNIGDLAHYGIDPAVAKDLTKFVQTTATPAGLAPFLAVWDSLTNLTKAAQTALWPANHARNQMTAAFQNFVHDAFNPNVTGPMRYVQPFMDAKAWQSGKVIPGAAQIADFAGLSPEQATQALAREITNWNVTRNVAKESQEVIGGMVKTGKELQVPGLAQPGLVDQLAKLKQTNVNPASADFYKQFLGVSGVAGKTADTFGPVAAGRGVGSYLDDLNRVSTYIAKRQQGFAPEAALMESLKTHYDFSKLSDFERGVMRRVVPFYSWARNNVPSVLQELATKPGGKMSVSIKAAGEARGQKPEFLPDYLGEGLAARVGEKSPEGVQRFLGSLGLPFEDVGQLTSARGFLGLMNPMLKAPAELATGKQFFTGRNLGDLHGPTGNVLLDQAVMNSPLSRFYTTGRTLLDERKDAMTKLLNLGTGARLTDVDLEKAKSLRVGQLLDEALQGPNIHHFQRAYVRPEDMANLSPHEMLLLRLNATREQQARQRSGR